MSSHSIALRFHIKTFVRFLAGCGKTLRNRVIPSTARNPALKIKALRDSSPSAAPRNGRAYNFSRSLQALAAFLFLFLAMPLMGQAGTILIEGTVRNASGVALSHARITLRGPNGVVVRSAVTNGRGLYQIGVGDFGAYSIKVDCAGYLGIIQAHVALKRSQNQTLNFTLKPSVTSRSQPQAHASLGNISFYQEHEFKAGTLKDPAAGGGYSDSASVQGNRMIQQYLLPTRRLPLKTSHSAAPRLGSNPDEAGFETAGSAFLARGDFAEATPLFRKAVLLYPQSARLEMGLGISLYSRGKDAEAVQALCRASRLAPDDSSPDVLLAEAMQFTSRPSPQAMRLLGRFSKMHPKNAAGHYAYAMGLWKKFNTVHTIGVISHAQVELEKAASLNPSFAAAHFQLGIVYDQERRTNRAIHEYRLAVRLNPNRASAHYRLAQDYARLGARKRAAIELEAFQRLRERREK